MEKQSLILTKSGKMISRFLLALFAGGAVAKSFEFQNWYLAIVGLSTLIWILEKSSRRLRFYLVGTFSTLYFLIHLTWMQVIGVDAWLLITLVSVLPWLLVAYLPINTRSLISIVMFASIVVSAEVIRSHFPLGGFPWGLIAYSQVDGELGKLAAFGGQSLVTFAAVVVAGLFVRIFSRKFLISTLVLSFVFIGLKQINFSANNENFKVVAIQGNVPRLGLELGAQREAVLNNHLSVTAQYLESTSQAQYPKLIIWPESSTDIDPIANREVATKIQNLVNRAGVPILVGATVWGTNPEGPRNTGILWQPDGAKDFYIKNHLVPFGEYIPMRDLLSDYIDRIALVPNDFVPGNELGSFKTGEITFGDVICFEVAYGDYIRHLVSDGAQFLTIQTNNATYGRTLQPEQQFQISRFRAIEHQRAVVIASTSGISGAILPTGEVLAKTSVFVPAIVEVEIPLSAQLSFSDKYPRWATFICLIFTIFAFVNSRFKRKIA